MYGLSNTCVLKNKINLNKQNKETFWHLHRNYTRDWLSFWGEGGFSVIRLQHEYKFEVELKDA